MKRSTDTLLSGLAFPEAPRWHNKRLWFTDQHAHQVIALSPDGSTEIIAHMDDRPGGLGWLPDGTPLVVAMTSRKILRITKTGLQLHADLSQLAPWHCNDMIVNNTGHAYVGNFGYDVDSRAPASKTRLIHIDPQGYARQTGGTLTFPNGMAYSSSGNSLLIAETFASRISVMTLSTNHSLSTLRLWASLPNATPDGICLDAEGALWTASPATGEILHVREGGAIVRRIKPKANPYACTLGGVDGRTLFICSANTHDPIEAAQLLSGRIETIRI